MRTALAWLAVLAMACGHGGGGKQTAPLEEPAPVPNEAPEILAKLRELTSQVCACTDNDCIERVSSERNRYTYQLTKDGKTDRLDKDAQDKSEALQQEYLACVRKLITPEPGKDSAGAKLLVEIVLLRDRMCACADAECVGLVREDALRLLPSQEHIAFDNDADERRASELANEMIACSKRVGEE